MAKDATQYVRPAVLRLLKREPTVTALVPAARIYPPQRPPNPDWPFIGYGVPSTTPFGASCLDGSAISVAVHAYAETTGEGDGTVGGEDMALAIVAAVVSVLGGDQGAEIDLQELGECPYPARAYISWTATQVVQDGAEADAFHAWATFTITVAS